MMNMDGRNSTIFIFSSNKNSEIDKDKSNTGIFNLVKNETNSVYLVFIIIKILSSTWLRRF